MTKTERKAIIQSSELEIKYFKNSNQQNMINVRKQKSLYNNLYEVKLIETK